MGRLHAGIVNERTTSRNAQGWALNDLGNRVHNGDSYVALNVEAMTRMRDSKWLEGGRFRQRIGPWIHDRHARQGVVASVARYDSQSVMERCCCDDEVRL